jgi:hypothetical protein
LDLRKYSVVRNDRGAKPIEPVLVPVGLVQLTLLLPVGSEPGEYEVRVLDSNLKARAEARGRGEIQNFVTTVRATVDLRDLDAGVYQLAVRRASEDWMLFPALVR